MPPRVESDERSISAHAYDVTGRDEVARGAENVDDDAAAALGHHLVDLSRQIDVAEYLEVPGLSPACLVDLLQATARHGASIVHENVDIATGLSERSKGNTCDPDPLGRDRFWDTFCEVGSLDMQLARRTWQAADKIIIETEAAPYEPKVAHRHGCSRECVAK